MGLDTTHDAWHGGYGMFHAWRTWIAKQEGIPLGLMQGFYAWQWDDDDDKLYPTKFQPLWELGGDNRYFETLKAVENFGGGIPWSVIKSKLVPLLTHSDCDGEIPWEGCDRLADALEMIVEDVKDDFKAPIYAKGVPNSGEKLWEKWDDSRAKGTYDGMVPATRRFIKGLRLAAQSKENLGFH